MYHAGIDLLKSNILTLTRGVNSYVSDLPLEGDIYIREDF
tara:strand:+ start:529 stop:648 length:120 start_codon:yes stop_codon:yes gene_type:complete